MHEHEIHIAVETVERLIANQFPHLAHLPVVQVPHGGTDHAIFRIGNELVARFPRIDWAREQPMTDAGWLPYLAKCLPLQIPVPVAIGEPGEGYPWSWCIVPWIEGENPDLSNIDLEQAALDLGRFFRSLKTLDCSAGPVVVGPARGCPLAVRNEHTLTAIRDLGDRIDQAATMSAWERALSVDAWHGPGTWLHGDLEPGNLLARDGKLVAVIDFGALGVGDPAVDLLPAWSLFSGSSREQFRKESGADDDMWERGKGWALTTALLALPYYWDTSPAMVATAFGKIEQVLGGP